jgi:vancomycin permeability regulator SanA
MGISAVSEWKGKAVDPFRSSQRECSREEVSVGKGMKEADIRIDDGGLDTYSTIYRCRDAFPGKTFLVCTQKKYFKRTGYLIQQLEMKGNCVGIDVHSYKKEGYEKFRDFFAADKAWIECNITKPAPEYSLKELPVQ